MPFELPNLSYEYSSLEPIIDTATMEIHYSKHHAAYTANLNNALQNYPNLQTSKIEQLLANLNQIPDEIREQVKNNGGGYLNHSFYWEVMTPGGSKEPGGQLAQKIREKFGNLEQLKLAFIKEAVGRFGSGWAWLAAGSDKNIFVYATSNQETPIMTGHKPLLTIDVWEHAYYLKYQNRRNEYAENWWNLINWDIVSQKYNQL